MAWKNNDVIIVLLCLAFSAHSLLGEHVEPKQADKGRTPLNRVKRSEPINYDIYTLDHFIELVEKIERNTTNNKDTLKKVINYIRLLGKDNDLFNVLCGKADPLPGTALINEEKRILTTMVTYSFIDHYNEEQGVVLTADNETIAIGRIMTGLCAGLMRDNSVSLKTWAPGSPYIVDNLFAATIAYDLARSALFSKNAGKTSRFGPSGSWSADQECPANYFLNGGEVTNATDALILGGVDGFILGQGLPKWESKGVRLGQILRMYYGSGILYDTSYASCKRKLKFKELVKKDRLIDQIKGMAFALHDKYSSQLKNIESTDIASLANDIGVQFFPYFEMMTGRTVCSTFETREDCEIPANIVFVMDESGSIKYSNYQKEKKFVSEMIQKFDISPRQARVAIVEYASSASLSVAFDNYGSKTRLMCAVKDLGYLEGGTNTAQALEVTQYNVLEPALANPVGDVETVQIVVVLTDGRSDDQGETKDAATNLKKGIKDLTVIAVGVANYNFPELREIATNPETHVFTAKDFDELLNLVASLRKKACTAPVYVGLNFTTSEEDTEVVAFVSPNKARFFTIPAAQFFGAGQIYIDVIPQFGTVTVYASRIFETPGPDNHTQSVGPAGEGENIQLEFVDLCAGYNSSDTCPPIYIGIYGESSSLSCSEQDCNLPNQIKFKIRRGKPPANKAKRIELHVFVQIVFFVLTVFISS